MSEQAGNRKTVTAILFAGLAEAAGARRIELEVAREATVAEVVAALAARYPWLVGLLERSAVALGDRLVGREAVLEPGAELVLIPPISGGSDAEPAVWLEPGPLSIDLVMARVAHPDAGAVVLFAGTVRERTAVVGSGSEVGHAGSSGVGWRHTEAIEYEAYEPMARAEMTRIAREASERWPGVRLSMAHRTGRLAVGEVAVVIAASAPHRPDAFSAARFAIEMLKRSVPIWKKEIGPDGRSWLGEPLLDFSTALAEVDGGFPELSRAALGPDRSSARNGLAPRDAAAPGGVSAPSPWRAWIDERGLSSRFVKIDGARLHVVEPGWSPPSVEPPLLFLHGFGGNAFSWREQLPVFGRTRPGWAIDLLGFGLSDAPVPGDYSLDAQAARALAFLDTVRAGRAVLVGNSMGGEVALRAALLAPERVAGLVLIDPSAFILGPPGWMRWIARFGWSAGVFERKLDGGGGFEQMLRACFADPDQIPESVRTGYRIVLERPELGQVMREIIRTVDFGARRDQLGGIKCPSLIIWGEKDRVIPMEHGHRLARALPKAELKLIPDAGHVPNEERPAVVNEWIEAFLARVTS